MPTVALGIDLGCDVTWREEKEKKKGWATLTEALSVDLTLLQGRHGLAGLGCVLRPTLMATETLRAAVGRHTPRAYVRRGVLRWAGLAGPYADGPDISPSA
jgi:hypothetical protein